MSGLGGMLRLGKAPLDGRALRRLEDALAPLGPGAPRRLEMSEVSLVSRPGPGEAVPPGERAFGLAQRDLLVWDGWLDNAPELGVCLALGSDASVPDIVCAAYHRWGLDFPSRLIGAFALALWDPRARRLCLAVDAMGSRPLYYHQSTEDDGTLLWANRARALVHACDLPRRIDDDYIAAYLANGVSDHSPYQGVRQIPGGHLLVAEGRHVELRRYWGFDPERRITYRHDGDYEEHFLQVFRQAVACRMLGTGPIFAELSGGLDSSAIVCTAHDLMRRGEIPERPFETLSYVFSESTTADESGYIEAVEGTVGKTGTRFDEPQYRILSKRLPVGFEPDLPTNHLAFLARYDAVATHMAAAGGHTLLSGIGGDQALWSEAVDGPVEVADLWVAGRPLAALRRAYRWSRTLQAPLGRVIRAGLARRSPIRGILPPGVTPWLQADFISRTGLDQPPADDQAATFQQPSKALQHARIRHTMRPFALQRCQSVGRVEVRYPFLDQRLLELVLAMPLEQLLRPGETRSVMRRALAPVLPPAVLRRRTKAGPSESFQRAVIRQRHWLQELFTDPLSARLGILDGDAFTTALHHAQHGIVPHGALMQSIVSMEIWLRSLFPEDAVSAPAPQPIPQRMRLPGGRPPAHARVNHRPGSVPGRPSQPNDRRETHEVRNP